MYIVIKKQLCVVVLLLPNAINLNVWVRDAMPASLGKAAAHNISPHSGKTTAYLVDLIRKVDAEKKII